MNGMWNYNLAKQYLSDYQWCFVHEKPIKKKFTCISIWKFQSFWNHFVAVKSLSLFEKMLYNGNNKTRVLKHFVWKFRSAIMHDSSEGITACLHRWQNFEVISVQRFDPGRSSVWVFWRCFWIFFLILSFLTISFTMFLLVTQGLLMIRCVMICFINPVITK